MNWLDIDFVKCDKTENRSLVVTMALIYLTNNKETLSRLLTSKRELSGEAKAIIIKRMAELEDERSFEL